MRCVGRGGPGLPSILTRKQENCVQMDGVTASNMATRNSSLALNRVCIGTSKSMSMTWCFECARRSKRILFAKGHGSRELDNLISGIYLNQHIPYMTRVVAFTSCIKYPRHLCDYLVFYYDFPMSPDTALMHLSPLLVYAKIWLMHNYSL